MLSEKKKVFGKLWRTRNKDRIEEYRLEYVSRNKDKYKQYEFKRNLKRFYNITIEDYTSILSTQNGLCAICGQEEKVLGRRLSVDHDHTNHVVRGLLCVNCNFIIGHCQESITILEKAISYLETKGAKGKITGSKKGK